MNTPTSNVLRYGIATKAAPFSKTRSPALLHAFRRCENGTLTLTTPDGRKLEFGGKNPGPNAEIHIYDWKALDELVMRGDIGFGEAYMDCLWDSSDISAVLTFGLVNGKALEKFYHGRPWHVVWLAVRNWLRGNSLKGSRRNIMEHYDLGNAFYKLWLDDSMTYSGALFEGDASRTLEQAQQAKYDRILNKLDAKPGAHILEIGCGWGGFAEAAARRGYRVTGVTLSKEQAEFARNRMREKGFDKLVTIELTDYRHVRGTFDAIASIGMFEHVGREYWPVFFETVHNRLVPGGKAMIQSITLDDDVFERSGNATGFIEHYIFPGGLLPSRRRFREAAENAGLACAEQYAFGHDYARTLREWLARFDARKPEVKAMGFDETFVRLWRFYLSICIASFDSERSSLMQAELIVR